MTKDEFAKFQQQIFDQLKAVRQAGQDEYAGGEDAFGNFKRLSKMLNISKEKVLIVYFTKHFDGILSYLNGHTSQREPVQGRIKDAIMYLMLLWGMIEEDENFKKQTDKENSK